MEQWNSLVEAIQRFLIKYDQLNKFDFFGYSLWFDKRMRMTYGARDAEPRIRVWDVDVAVKSGYGPSYKLDEGVAAARQFLKRTYEVHGHHFVVMPDHKLEGIAAYYASATGLLLDLSWPACQELAIDVYKGLMPPDYPTRLCGGQLWT